jgi:hypothetical protein
MKYCKVCGLITTDNDAVCRSCGAPLYSIQEVLKSHPSRFIIAGAVSVCLLLVLALTLILFPGRTKLTRPDAQQIVDEMILAIYKDGTGKNVFLDATADVVSVQVDELTRKKDVYYAQCTVTTVDVAPAMEALLQNVAVSGASSYDEALQTVADIVRHSSPITAEFTVQFYQEDDSYTAVIPEQMLLFCMGNLQEEPTSFPEMVGME